MSSKTRIVVLHLKQYNTVGARVISKGSGNWFEIFAIDKGSKDGIKKDMNVIADVVSPLSLGVKSSLSVPSRV